MQKSKFPWEIGHMFVTEDLYNAPIDIKTVEVPELSDHDPIIANYIIKKNSLSRTNVKFTLNLSPPLKIVYFCPSAYAI